VAQNILYNGEGHPVAGEAGGFPQLQVRCDLRQARPDHGRRALLQRGGQQPVQPVSRSPRQDAHTQTGVAFKGNVSRDEYFFL
jgi:hypothetical protein